MVDEHGKLVDALGRGHEHLPLVLREIVLDGFVLLHRRPRLCCCRNKNARAPPDVRHHLGLEIYWEAAGYQGSRDFNGLCVVDVGVVDHGREDLGLRLGCRAKAPAFSRRREVLLHRLQAHKKRRGHAVEARIVGVMQERAL
jgi:hypothetical protein